jgi:protein-S-isoprenylcysteine O-methyltransferase Ste14
VSQRPAIANAPAWAQRLRRFNDWMLFDIGGGPRPLNLATVINLQKAGSFPFLAFLIWWYADRNAAATSTAAWLYLAMHGTYGLTWLLKDLLFPDPNWQRPATIASCIVGALGLGLYWLGGWLLISGTVTPEYPLPQNAWFCVCLSLCILGCVIMIASDVQKFVTLQLRRGLITTGMFRWVRHPNYLGEMMVYGSLAMMVWHWIPALVLAYFWLVMFSTNMVMKEASMSRYPEWADYRRRTWWLVPGVF